MLFMATGGLGFAALASNHPDSGFWSFLKFHTTHAAWIGGGAWDFIQPSFMLMVGVAIPFSLASKLSAGVSQTSLTLQALGRSCLVSFDLAGPKLRTGPIQPGLSVAKWRPKKNRLGQVVVPVRVRFCNVPMEGDSGEVLIPVKGDLVARAQPGDHVCLVDARGRDRSLRVIEAMQSYCVCEARETAYVIPRTRMALRRNRRTIAQAVVAEMPAVPRLGMRSPTAWAALASTAWLVIPQCDKG